ncbi:MAG TPA: imidazole glycerol phosphate synthase subunit HisF [Fimbriimonadaceae bacterium]|nr:imidazole glycerol phosphate synthase subunit HisF [Fimbriimonadaceae bacterium]
MTSIRVIPCLDIQDGRVVKGIQFRGLRDAGDPVELARFYDAEGADELVFLDITASSDSRAPVIDLAERVAEQVFIPFTVGGGIRDLATIRDVLKAGADKVSLNSAAIANPEFVRQAAEAFGSQCIVGAIDARRSSTGWSVFSHGGRHDTAMDAVDWAKELQAQGAGEILLTSMDADGAQTGYDLELTQKVSNAVSIPVIASGGAGNPAHLIEAVQVGRADAVLVASIVHDGNYRIRDLKKAIVDAGLEIRTLPNS